MPFTVEDGSGVVGANALISVAQYKAHCDLRGVSYSGVTDAAIEQAIVRATDWLNSLTWKGRRRYPRGASKVQGTAFPRVDMTDSEGFSVDYASVPDEVIDACAMVAVLEVAQPGAMKPTVTPGQMIKATSAGPVSVEFMGVRTDAESMRPVLLGVRDLISGLLSSYGRSPIVGAAYRA